MIKSFDMNGQLINFERLKDKTKPIQIAFAYIYIDMAVIKVDGNGKNIYPVIGSYCMLKNLHYSSLKGLLNTGIWFINQGAAAEFLVNGDLSKPLRLLSEKRVAKANKDLKEYLQQQRKIGG